MITPRWCASFLCFAILAPGLALADTPLAERFSFRRASDFFATGATLAEDTDNDDKVDTLRDSATVLVEELDLAPGAFLQQALIYWGGTIAENANCAGPDSSVDAEVLVTVPGGSATMVTADTCYCSGADNQSRDVQACRADVSSLVQGAGGQLLGPWTVGSFQANIDDGDVDTASFSLVLIYGAPDLPARQLTIYDGLRTMRYDEVSFQLDDLEVDDPPAGELTLYALEGDIGGSDDESVMARGLPGGRSMLLSDDVNPAQGLINRTINTTYPPQEGVVGVDIDTFDISDALVAGDTSLEVTYAADSDKWWLVFNIVGVRLFFSEFSQSSLSWTLSDDADGDGAPTPGDELRYTAELVNSGEGNATVSLTADMPPEAASWSLLSTEGGADNSTAAALSVDGVAVDAGGSARVDFVLRIAEVPEGTPIRVAMSFAADGGGGGLLEAPEVTVGSGSVSDTFGDDDDDGRIDGEWSQGCACSSAAASTSPPWAVLLLLGLLRRRRQLF
ncbi:MAG: DUF11 domain-containing protein [Deltaproteobacteria bacterium]|nr:DUF11 domain-containing protein [Deltaproteobacteria bacterium]